MSKKDSITNEKTRILYLGSGGFPFGSAAVQRQIQLAKSLIHAGYEVTVVNNRSTHDKKIARRESLKILGRYQGIQYFYSSLFTYRPKNIFVRKAARLTGNVIEVLTLLYFKVFKRTNHILLRAHKLKTLKYYYFITRVLKLELIYDYVEFYDSISNRDIVTYKNTKNSFDFNLTKYLDKVIVISVFLDNHIMKLNADVPVIKIPPIIDFDYFKKIEFKRTRKPFFLFCGSAAYMDIIEFIINSYSKSIAINNGYGLKLVINGNSEQLGKLNDFIEKNGKKIELLTKLPYLDLIGLYKSATALLIPISNNLQDAARFPFKICEYVASSNPIITSDAGAITEYFEDNVNAFIAVSDNVDDFTNKLNIVIGQPELAVKVGNTGYEFGKTVFNYKSYSEDLRKLIESR
ncbi:glycosyltransferase family 4 protein [Aureibaculum conchae]|uniref:glycosyltransferase family 4 protein n=1 Tax=Aureibaculum sp. 2308TA14-22 TaxID=3108392 RepID=UPI00339359C7